MFFVRSFVAVRERKGVPKKKHTHREKERWIEGNNVFEIYDVINRETSWRFPARSLALLVNYRLFALTKILKGNLKDSEREEEKGRGKEERGFFNFVESGPGIVGISPGRGVLPSSARASASCAPDGEAPLMHAA